MQSSESKISRFLATFGPDYAQINNDIVLYSKDNRLGIIPIVERNWGMQSEALVVGSSLVSFCRVRPGSIKFETSQDPDDVTLLFIFTGSIKTTIRSSMEQILRTDAVYFLMPGVQGTITWPNECTFVTLRVPSAVLTELGTFPETDHGELSGAELLAKPAAAFLRNLATNKADSSVLTSYFIEKIIQEIAGSLFLSHNGISNMPAPEKTQLYQRAISIINAKRADPLLDPATVAEDLSVSLRQLQREFKDHDETLSDSIRKSRVQLAIHHLRNSAYQGLTVEEVAKYSGFQSARQLRTALSLDGHPSPIAVRKSSVDLPSITPAVIK